MPERAIPPHFRGGGRPRSAKLPIVYLGRCRCGHSLPAVRMLADHWWEVTLEQNGFGGDSRLCKPMIGWRFLYH